MIVGEEYICWQHNKDGMFVDFIPGKCTLTHWYYDSNDNLISYPVARWKIKGTVVSNSTKMALGELNNCITKK